MTFSVYFLLLCAFGLCFAIQHKFTVLRDRHPFMEKVLDCSYCVGFHCGWKIWIVTHGIPDTPQLLVDTILFAFGSSATCYILDGLMSYLEANSEIFSDESP